MDNSHAASGRNRGGVDGGNAVASVLETVIAVDNDVDQGVFIGAERVIGNVNHRRDRDANRLRYRVARVVGDGDGKAVRAVVVSHWCVAPGATGRIDAGRAVCRCARDGVDRAISQTVNVGRCQGGCHGGAGVLDPTAADASGDDGGVIDRIDRDVDRGGLGHASRTGHGVSETVSAVVVGRWRVSDVAATQAHRAVARRAHGTDHRTAFEAVVAKQARRQYRHRRVFIGAERVIGNVNHRRD